MLLAAAPAAAQVPAVGGDATLDVATWNVEWFGAANGPSDDARQRANVADVILESGVDLWALQEMADADDFEDLLDDLGDGWAGVLATISSQQRVGFVYRTDVFENVVVRHLLTEFEDAFATRPPLELTARAVLPDTTLRLSFITVHMKAFSDQGSYDKRAEAAQRLKNHLDFLRAGEPIVVLGDFNDRLTGSIRSGQPSPYAAFVADSTDYRFLTLALERAGQGTFCGSNPACDDGAFIDHILVTDELAPAYLAGSAARFDALLDAFDGTGGACGGEFVCTTSDHLPVFARFRFGQPTSTGGPEAVPERLAVTTYPNPFQQHTTVAVTLPRAAHLRVEVYDLLGRRVETLADAPRAAGTHRLPLDAEGLPPGLYLVRTAVGTEVHVQRVMLVR